MKKNFFVLSTTQRYFIFFLIYFVSFNCQALSIIIPKTIVDQSTVIENADLDMSNGSFTIENNATLTIKNSRIVGTISPKNPYLFSVATGKLILKNNTVSVNAVNINPTPYHISLYNTINVVQGSAKVLSNSFTIDKPYTASLLATKTDITNNIVVAKNRVYNFHGGIVLRNSHFSVVANNAFYNVSNSNVFLLESSNSNVLNNTILFAGNNNVGDGIDFVDSRDINLKNNFISSGSCYSIVIMRCKNVVIDRNNITGGITYAITILPALDLPGNLNAHLVELIGKPATRADIPSENIIVINNYFSQNRFGLAATTVNGLIVKNNYFIQHFTDTASRLFWTNNDILMRDVTNLTWKNNFYKEAYTQDIKGNNAIASNFVLFPDRGGVFL